MLAGAYSPLAPGQLPPCSAGLDTTRTSGSVPDPPPQAPLQTPLGCQVEVQAIGQGLLFTHADVARVAPCVCAQAVPPCAAAVVTTNVSGRAPEPPPQAPEGGEGGALT